MAKRTINEQYIASTFKYPIDRKLELGEDLEILIKGSVVKKEILDQQDGSVDIIYKVKPLEAELLNKGELK